MTAKNCNDFRLPGEAKFHDHKIFKQRAKSIVGRQLFFIFDTEQITNKPVLIFL